MGPRKEVRSKGISRKKNPIEDRSRQDPPNDRGRAKKYFRLLANDGIDGNDDD